MNKKMNKICIFDINNKQEEYSCCLEIIKEIETGQSKRRNGMILELSKRINVSIGDVPPKIFPRYIEQPISFSQRADKKLNFYKEAVENKHSLTPGDLQEVNEEVHYHLRVHMKDSETSEEHDFIHLQYLALMMCYLNELSFFSRKTKKN